MDECGFGALLVPFCQYNTIFSKAPGTRHPDAQMPKLEIQVSALTKVSATNKVWFACIVATVRIVKNCQFFIFCKISFHFRAI